MRPTTARRGSAPAVHALPRRCVLRLMLVAVAASMAIALLAASLLSMKVAHARDRLNRIEQRITDVQRDNIMLATEMGVRAAPARLDNFNAAMPGLEPPRVGQYLDGVAALEGLARPLPGTAPTLAYDLPPTPARAL